MMREKRKRKQRFGGLAFFLPIALIGVIVVWGIVSASLSQDGTLDVQAVSSARYSAMLSFKVEATVNGNTAMTPFNETLAQGIYTVTYGAVQWFSTPDPRTVVVHGGITTYAIGVYDPVLRVVGIGNNGFNATSVTALHGVTPVVWLNTSTRPLYLHGGPLTAPVAIQPGQNYTSVIKLPGNYTFGIFTTNYSITVVTV